MVHVPAFFIHLTDLNPFHSNSICIWQQISKITNVIVVGTHRLVFICRIHYFNFYVPTFCIDMVYFTLFSFRSFDGLFILMYWHALSLLHPFVSFFQYLQTVGCLNWQPAPPSHFPSIRNWSQMCVKC